MRCSSLGDFGYDVYLPHAYDPNRSYQVMFQLLKWSARDDDRTMLFGAELHVPVRP